MVFAENSINTLNFGKEEELQYQISELLFHVTQARKSFEDVTFHLKKIQHHSSLLKNEGVVCTT